MVESSNLVQELLDSERLIAQVLHVDLPLSLIHQEHTWGEHSHPANAVHTFDFLLHALFGELFVQDWNSILFAEALFNDASLTEKFTQEKTPLGSLAYQISLIVILHHFCLFIITI